MRLNKIMDSHNIIEDDFHHFAYDEKGKLIYLSKNNDPIKRDNYKCLACGEVMRAVMGKEKIRDWHFRHIKKNPNCNKESYLHLLAKKIIKERFDNSESFIIKYDVKKVCPESNVCPKHSDSCDIINQLIFNLKESYDTCEIETKDSHFPFRADLKLSSKKNPRRKPVFFEIAYTHDCENEKIESGIQIIELKVYEDKDINCLLEENLEEPMKLDFTSKNPYQFCKLPDVRFYNFKRQKPFKDISKKCKYRKAKDLFINLFNQSETIFLNYNGLRDCSNINTCPLACDACLKQKTIITEDLKCIYDVCTEDKEGNLVLTKTNSEIPTTTLRFSLEKKPKYVEDSRVIEFLNCAGVQIVLREDLMHIDLKNPNNPYSSTFLPNVRFYNFNRMTKDISTISLNRFAVVKDGGNTIFELLEKTDCHHIDNWPSNVVFGLLSPEIVVKNLDFYSLCMIKACLKGYKVYDCSFCKYCYNGHGGCIRYGNYMYNLLENKDIDTVEESRKCNNYVINTVDLQNRIGKFKIPIIEWSKPHELSGDGSSW